MRRLLLLLTTLTLGLVLLSTSPSQAASYPNLSQGSSGANVTSLQFLLTSRGFSTAADGEFGSGTRDAVAAFQSAAGLDADGVAGPQTFTALVPVLRQGDRGPAVQALQVQLNKHGSSLDTDGDFGPATAGAVQAFQSANGLDADGVVGQATWTTLLGTGGGGEVPGTTYDSLSNAQKANARTIIGVAKGASVPEYGWVVALAAAMQESTLLNIDYGDRDSLGLFQQRPSQGWGSAEQILDPVLASKAFFGVASHTSNRGLLDIAGWESMSVSDAAQAVQISCCPSAYGQWESLARDIVAHESGAPSIP
ncbi:peptidoglycan-binding domain-containing protein [Nocardioides sp. GXZ039]|uniref:peptidoglycan-binding domain-containing protein n=1 Tax=Nocardioides sp. GXZ039 TaxID=3136018 RepID=UPI004040BDDA